MPMKIEKVYPGQVIQLGRRGENLARQVEFDLTDWKKQYGEGVPELLFQRFGDARPFIRDVEVVENRAIWTLTSWDTDIAKPGKVELRWYCGELLAKSQSWSTSVENALDTPGVAPAVNPEKSWFDEVLIAATGVGAHAAAAKASADDAAASAQEAAEQLANIGESAQRAEEAQAKSEEISKRVNQRATAASVYANNAKVYAEGGSLKELVELPNGDVGIGFTTEYTRGAEQYAEAAEAAANGGTYANGSFIFSETGAKRYADKAKAYAEGGTYQEYDVRQSFGSATLNSFTVSKGAKQYASDARFAASDADTAAKSAQRAANDADGHRQAAGQSASAASNAATQALNAATTASASAESAQTFAGDASEHESGAWTAAEQARDSAIAARTSLTEAEAASEQAVVAQAGAEAAQAAAEKARDEAIAGAGAGSSGKIGQANWSVDTENAPGYVYNRTHWVSPITNQINQLYGLPSDKVFIPAEGQFKYDVYEFDDTGNDELNLEFDEAYPYRSVQWNGVMYTNCPWTYDDETDCYYLGNQSLFTTMGDTGEPFCFKGARSNLYFSGTIRVKSDSLPESTPRIYYHDALVYHKLDRGYLPDDAVLPTITGADSGKVLSVVGGAPAWSDAPSGGGTGEPEVFIAEYDVTTGAELEEAYQAGKVIIARRVTYSAPLMARRAPKNFVFVCYQWATNSWATWTCNDTSWVAGTATHASMHSSTGADPITPESIGAASTAYVDEAVANAGGSGGVAFVESWVSTSAEVEAAYQSGKLVVCVDAGMPFHLVLRRSATEHWFANVDSEYYCTYCVINDEWDFHESMYAPRSHADNHKATGWDPITPESIGAVTKEYVDEAVANAGSGLPAHTTADNGKFLRIVNGAPAWATVQNAEGVSF